MSVKTAVALNVTSPSGQAERPGLTVALPVPAQPAWQAVCIVDLAALNPQITLGEAWPILAAARHGWALAVQPGTLTPVGVLDIAALASSYLAGATSSDAPVATLTRSWKPFAVQGDAPEALLQALETRKLDWGLWVGANDRLLGVVSTAALMRQQNRDLKYVGRKMEAALEQIRAESQKIERENAEVMAVLAHDMRGPLNGILGLMQLMRDTNNPLEDHVREEFVRVVMEEAQNLVHLTKDVMELSKTVSSDAALKWTEVKPDYLLKECGDLYQEMARRKGIAFSISMPEGEAPVILADKHRLHTVLANLMDNAVKYCKAGESIRVGLEITSVCVRFVVADTGQGLPKEELPRLFKRFGRGTSRPTNNEPSTGLGLAISKEIINAHGGQISVTGDKGKGLAFRVSMPIHDDSPLFK